MSTAFVPACHPGESNARQIELTWIKRLLGSPKNVPCNISESELW